MVFSILMLFLHKNSLSSQERHFDRGSIIVCGLCYKSVCKIFFLKGKIQCVRYNLIFRSFAQKKEDKIYVFCTKRINFLECGSWLWKKYSWKKYIRKEDKKKNCFWMKKTKYQINVKLRQQYDVVLPCNRCHACKPVMSCYCHLV